ncbi:MAG: hypothetical protein J2O48_02695 [Solirubrobacterales bacterium]|nr:hypothetical protein [Solirubrobacterales bacterium]
MDNYNTLDLPGPDQEAIETDVCDLLACLNGASRFSAVLWKLPDGLDLDEVSEDDPAHEHYIQCAGDFNGRMTCEIRELVDGKPRHYVLGRAAEADEHALADQIVPWNGYEARVHPNEVLTGGEVADLFRHYYRTGTNPSTYSHRLLGL